MKEFFAAITGLTEGSTKLQILKNALISQDYEKELKDIASDYEKVIKADKQTIQDLNHKLSLKEESKTPPESQVVNQFEGTVCATTQQLKVLVDTVPQLSQKKFKAEKKYQASKDGQQSKDFHDRLDGVQPTVTLCKLSNDVTVAAFANQKWETGGGLKRDSECMLLNLTN